MFSELVEEDLFVV